MKYTFAAALACLGVAASAQQMSVSAGLTTGSMSRVSPMLSAQRKVENFEPALVHPKQEQVAKAKLDALYKRTGKRPNILIFMIDDLGYSDMGAYGGGEALGTPTPHMDRLAREGLKLTSTYAQPTCTPTRAALNTGRLPVRSGLLEPALLNDRADSSQEIFAAKILSAAGYRTALSGKWHLGEKEGSRPWQVGFDEFYGFLGVINAYQDDHPSFTEIANDPVLLAQLRSMPGSRSLWSASREKGGQQIQTINWENSGELDQKFADFSEQFIRRAVKAGQPFYLSHNFSKVHARTKPTPAYVGRSATKDSFHDSVIEIDDIIGRLTKLLEKLGVAENTLIFLTSDNGPADDRFPEAGATPFRGSKGMTTEGGVRVPGVFWWPGMIQPNRVSDGLFDMTDMFNTSLAVAGIDPTKAIPSDRYVDGIDQSSFLLADDGQSAREAVYFWRKELFTGVRWRYYKMSTTEIELGSGNARDIGGLDNARDVKPLNAYLYNLYLDPKERKSVLIEKAWVPSYVLGPLISLHGATMAKYPTKTKVRFQ